MKKLTNLKEKQVVVQKVLQAIITLVKFMAVADKSKVEMLVTLTQDKSNQHTDTHIKL